MNDTERLTELAERLENTCPILDFCTCYLCEAAEAIRAMIPLIAEHDELRKFYEDGYIPYELLQAENHDLRAMLKDAPEPLDTQEPNALMPYTDWYNRVYNLLKGCTDGQ